MYAALVKDLRHLFFPTSRSAAVAATPPQQADIPRAPVT